MKRVFERLAPFFDLRTTLIVIVAALGLIALNIKWQDSLKSSLVSKQDELGDSLAMVQSNIDVKGREKETESFKAMKSMQNDNWTDSIPALVTDQKLILRQVRPLGIEQKGKIKEEKVFLQVDGNVDGVLGFLHHMASEEFPIHVSRYLITTRTIGTGFVSVEIVLSRILLT